LSQARDKIFLSTIKVPHLLDIRAGILERYRKASSFYEECVGTLGRKRVLGQMRSGLFEDTLLSVCQKDESLYAVSDVNRKHNWGFALVEAPGLIFTGTTLRSINARPRAAEYRRNLGVQGTLMGPQPASDRLDAILIHVPPRGTETRPAALVVRFLNGNGVYFPEMIDLLRLEEAAAVRTVVRPPVHLPRVRPEKVERTTRVFVKRSSESHGDE